MLKVLRVFLFVETTVNQALLEMGSSALSKTIPGQEVSKAIRIELPRYNIGKYKKVVIPAVTRARIHLPLGNSRASFALVAR